MLHRLKISSLSHQSGVDLTVSAKLSFSSYSFIPLTLPLSPIILFTALLRATQTECGSLSL